MEKKELLNELIKLVNDGFTSVELSPLIIKEHSQEAYSCILETLQKKVEKKAEWLLLKDNYISIKIKAKTVKPIPMLLLMPAMLNF